MDFRIGHKLIASFGLLIALTVGLGWYLLDNLQHTRTVATRAIDGDLNALEMLRQQGNGRREMSALIDRALAAHLLRKAGAAGDDPSLFVRERALAAERARARIQRLAAIAEQRQKTGIIPARAQLWAQINSVAKAMETTLGEITGTGNTLLELIRRDDMSEYRANVELLARLQREASGQEQKVAELIDSLGNVPSRACET